MFGIDRRLLQNFDWMLLLLVISIVGVGIVNLASATHVDDELTDEVRRQLVSLGIGGIAMLLVLAIDYRHYERFAIAALVVCIALLAATLIFAPVIRGSQSWLFGGRLQPSELAKIGLVIALARYFHRNPPSEIRRLRELVRPGLITVVPIGLIVMQRDMGVALLTLLIASTYLAFTRISWRSWVGAAVVELPL